jgi:hypothetical protein
MLETITLAAASTVVLIPVADTVLNALSKRGREQLRLNQDRPRKRS